MTPEQERNYNNYNQSETTTCPKCGKDFIFVRRARIGTVAYRQAGRNRKYCYDCSPPSNTKARNNLAKWTKK